MNRFRCFRNMIPFRQNFKSALKRICQSYENSFFGRRHSGKIPMLSRCIFSVSPLKNCVKGVVAKTLLAGTRDSYLLENIDHYVAIENIIKSRYYRKSIPPQKGGHMAMIKLGGTYSGKEVLEAFSRAAQKEGGGNTRDLLLRDQTGQVLPQGIRVLLTTDRWRLGLFGKFLWFAKIDIRFVLLPIDPFREYTEAEITAFYPSPWETPGFSAFLNRFLENLQPPACGWVPPRLS